MSFILFTKTEMDISKSDLVVTKTELVSLIKTFFIAM